MELQGQTQGEMYELVPVTSSSAFKATALGQRRALIGRSHHCDLVILDATVSGIHAVIEISSTGVTLFDLNSTNGCFVNGNKVITQKLNVGDKIRFGLIEVELRKYNFKDISIPELESLKPGKELNSAFMPTPPQFLQEEDGGVISKKRKSVLPIIPKVEKGNDGVNYISYPLAQDPKAEFSEYIFEDADDVYPIFNYKVEESAVEVVILFKDTVISVDYLPSKTASYYLVGFDPKKKIELVEFPYLGRGDKFEFIKVHGSNIDVFLPEGFSSLHLEDRGRFSQQANPMTRVMVLGTEEILLLRNGDLQIFVRRTPSPPEVKVAPILQRDEVLKRLVFLMFILVIGFSVGVNLVTVDEELVEDKIPDRVATILYKQRILQPEKVKPITIEKPVEKPEKEKLKTQVPLTQEEEKMQGKTFDSSVKDQPQTTTQQGMSPDAKSEEPPKLATTKVPKPEKVKSNFVAPKRSDQIGGRPEGGSKQQQTTNVTTQPSTARGQVETYKSSDFSSTLSALMAKGGGQLKSGASSIGGGQGGDVGLTDKVSGGSPNGAVQRADVEQNVGSLTGAASGKLAASKGAEGIIDKKTVLSAGFPAQTVVLGSIDPDVIRRILRENLPHFQRCYQSELDATFNKVTGNIPLNFTIGASGHVAAAGVSGASKFPARMSDCVLNVLRGITFPRPLGGGSVEVNQPLNFYPRN